MMNRPLWLPELVLFNDYQGNWEAYIDAVYEYFKQDFIENTVFFESTRIALKRSPLYQNKEYVFWHITTEGQIEDERTPDFRRCERIRWIRPIIEHCDDAALKVWENKRKNDNRVNLWLEEENYLVVLAKRSSYILLWTAYRTDRYHTRQKLNREYEEYHSENS